MARIPLTKTRRIVVVAVVAVLVSQGCGAAEPKFNAEGFLEEVNAGGAGLALGEPLESVRENVTSYELNFKDPGEIAGTTAPAAAHGGGTLQVTANSEAGAAEFERCEGAVSLVCFRAANVVFYFGEELAPAELARLAGALRQLAGE